ncbi:pyridoxal phosphate-dependent aminotransferase [Legionella maioricensis]|uniref:Aminotransferase n=1 Tax=Legionella maioricensis TaxID=2896528 RepID=A0A9X2D102_9GAMM|nr:pyridoxal phosphate-dependent aminotransferase [Legionella maioricensis]MCL9684504.1 pyridoxal phosphate-dependent aminotransferase [Legionella maioricensis]MCL9687902.1 pyridoxal phosphate-dependent aminotransferase [Legionella maioricensis]
MLTPEGRSGDKLDKTMLLNMWANTLNDEARFSVRTKPFIFAGMGKPTFPVNLHMVEMFLAYWSAIKILIKSTADAVVKDDKEAKPKQSSAIDYGDGRSDFLPRKVMAEAMTDWYNAPITADNVLYTAGGAGALHIIFTAFNSLYEDIPKYRVITPFPHYSLYAANKKHQLHPIDVMKEPGYQLTATALEASIKSAYKLAELDNNLPKVVLLCNPSNPLGTIIPEDELKKIAAVLRKYPDLKIVMDEAYAEMCWSSPKAPSLLTIAPDLRQRITILRSATKALSAAGERLGMLMTFDNQLMDAFREHNIVAIGHAARSAQLAYAYTMLNFSEEERQKLENYYKPKVEYVYERAKKMGAAMPDPKYKVDGTFYVLCDLSDLLGEEIPQEAKRALGKTGNIQTSEELVYSLLFQDSLMLGPGSYFGMPSNNGFVRITCSGDEEELKEIMDRLEARLLDVRQKKALHLINEINNQITQLDGAPETFSTLKPSLLNRLSSIKLNMNDTLDLKTQNIALKKLLFDVKCEVNLVTPESRVCLGQQLSAFFVSAKGTFKQKQKQLGLEDEWRKFVDENFTDGPVKNYFLNLKEEEKKTCKAWLQHLRTLENQNFAEMAPSTENLSETPHLKMNVA